MSFNRIWAMVIRYFKEMKHNLNRLFDMFYRPAMDLLIWGITGLYLAQLTKQGDNYLFIILSGLVFWVVVWRAQYEITTNLLSEFWNRNIVNLFTAPLTVIEWMSAFMIFGFIKTVISLAFSASLSLILYQYNILNYGWVLLFFVVNLIITGWSGGFIVAALIVRFGQKLEQLAWAGITFISPFSAIYYPVNILPQWAQYIAYFIPSSYIFETVREALFTGHISYDKLFISLGLNIVYFIFSVWFFVKMFNKSRKLGLGRLV